MNAIAIVDYGLCNLDSVRRAVEDLQTASQAMAQHLRQRQPAGGGRPDQAPGNGRAGGKDDVIDAEYEVKR